VGPEQMVERDAERAAEAKKAPSRLQEVFRGISDCQYDVHTMLSQEELARGNEELVREFQQLKNRNAMVESILSAVRAGEQAAAIVQWLKNGETCEAILEALDRTAR
jgi:hypothetical protein